MNFIKYRLFLIKIKVVDNFWGQIYKSKRIVSCGSTHNTADSCVYKEICNEFQVVNSCLLPEEFRPETNLNMRKFYRITISGGRIITDLGQNLAVFDSKNRIIEEASFTYVLNDNGYFYHAESRNNIFYKAKKIQKPVFFNSKVFSLLTGGGRNFNIYHWFFDSLVRLYAIKDEIDSIDFFLVPEYSQHYQIESLRFFGIEANRIISSSITKHIKAKELVVTSHPRTATYSIRPDLANFLRDKFSEMSLVKTGNYYPTAFYIVRKDAPRRFVVNEEEVIKKLGEISIASISISDYNFNEIVYLFQNASLVISTHSAALTNLLFCKPGTQVLEYFPDVGFLPYYQELCLSLGLHYFPVIEQIPMTNRIKSRYDLQNQKNVTINLTTVVNAINTLNENRIN